jgi:two-component system, LytTR family, response regulator
MPSIKAVIIEDNPKDALLLKGILAQDYNEIEIVSIDDTLLKGVASIRIHHPHLVFLDIELPQHNGMSLRKFLDEDERNFEIIFSTFHHEFAIESYELEAIGYLVKPMSSQKLKTPMKRLKKRLEEKNALHKIGVIKDVLKDEDSKRIRIATIEGQYFINPEEINYCKADGAYTEIFTETEKIYAGRNIKYFEELFSTEKYFMRVHRSYFVNLRKVAVYQAREHTYLLTLRDGTEVLLSPQKVNEFQQQMKNLDK